MQTFCPGTKYLESWPLKYSGNFNEVCTNGSHFLEPFIAQAAVQDLQLTLSTNIQKYWETVTWTLLQSYQYIKLYQYVNYIAFKSNIVIFTDVLLNMQLLFNNLKYLTWKSASLKKISQ